MNSRIVAGIFTAAVLAAAAPMLIGDADAAATRVFTGIGVRSGGNGYLLASARGEMYAFGAVTTVRNPARFTGAIADVALTADGRGAMVVSSAGQFYAYGTAVAQPNPRDFTGEMVALDLTADGRGVVALSSTGQVYAYGTARHHGNGDSGCDSFAGQAVCHDIRGRYRVLGGPSGPLGPPTGAEFTLAGGGLGQHFSTGSIYWSARTGAWEVGGEIRDKWESLGADQGVLGLPLGGGMFVNGAILYSPATGAHEVHGEIHRVYGANGSAGGALGLPLTDEVAGAGDWTGGRASFFRGGTIVWDGRGDTRIAEPSSADRRAEALTLMALPLAQFMVVQRNVDKKDTMQWETDGCSGPTGAEVDSLFDAACRRHDFGNRSFGPRNLRLDTSEKGFNHVNDVFLRDMRTICRARNNPMVRYSRFLPPARCDYAAPFIQRAVIEARGVWWDA